LQDIFESILKASLHSKGNSGFTFIDSSQPLFLFGADERD